MLKEFEKLDRNPLLKPRRGATVFNAAVATAMLGSGIRAYIRANDRHPIDRPVTPPLDPHCGPLERR